MAASWWGEQEGTKKTHCAKWGKLTDAKIAGGLDFRDLRAVNDALLAK